MAKVKKQDLFENNIFGSVKKQAEDSLKIFLSLDKTITDLAQSFSLLAKETKTLDSKNIDQINKAFSSSVKLREQSIKIDREQVQSKKNLEQIRREELKTERELEKNKRESIRTAKLVNTESERQRRAAEKLSRANELLSNKYKQLTTRTNEAQFRFKSLAAEFGINSRQANKARKEFERLDSRLRKINDAAKDGRRDVGRYGLALNGVGVSLRNVVGAFGVVSGVQLLASTVRDAFNTFREFSLENSRLAGLLNTNRSNISSLIRDSQRLGATTSKTATEVNKLQQAYARLGFSQKEILDLTEDTINGSVALNAELDETANLTGAIVNSFDEFDSSNAQEILDQLTLATQSSALNFEKLQTAIPVAAGAASAANVPFSVLVSQLAQASDRGIDASTAATSLRNIYIELSDSGLELEDALSQINNAQDKLSKANELFGKRAAVTALALADTTQQTNEFNEALLKADGTARRFAEETLDNVDGDIKLLTSAWQGLILTIQSGDGVLSNAFRGFIQGGTRAIQFLKNLDITIKLITGSIDDLSLNEFRTFLLEGELNSGNNINTFLESVGVNLRDLTKEFSELKEETDGLGEGFREFITLEEQRTRFLERTRKSIKEVLILQGESVDDAAEFALKYIELIQEQDEENKNLTESIKETTQAQSEQEEILGKIARIRKEISQQIEFRDTLFDEGKIEQTNVKITELNEELQRLLDLGKEIEEQEAPEPDFDGRADALANLVQTQKDIAAESIKIEADTLEETLKNIDNRTKAELDAAAFRFDEQKANASREIEDEIILKAELERIELEKQRALAKIQEDGLKSQVEAKEEFAEDVKGIDERLFKIAQGFARRQSEENLKEIDREIEGVTRRQNTLQQLAANGQKEATESLAIADKEQAELRLKREREVARQKKVEAGLAAFKILAAKTEAGDKNALSSTLLEIASTDAFINALPTFYDGTNNTGSGGGVDNKGGFLSVLHPEERVMTAEQNNMVGLNTPNELVADVMQKYNTGQLTNTYINNNRDVVRALNDVNRNISSLPNKMPIHEPRYDHLEGLIVDTIKTQGKVQKIKYKPKRVLG